jgi:hypothetical protein
MHDEAGWVMMRLPSLLIFYHRQDRGTRGFPKFLQI